MAQSEQVKGFVNNVLAGAVWDGLKQLWGPVVIAAVVAIWGKLKHGSLDWYAIVGMFLLASLLVFLNFRKPKQPPEALQRWKPKWQKLQWANAERERLELKVKELESQLSQANKPTENKLSDADPRIYLSEIKMSGEGMFPATPFVIENLGGTVAHKIQIQPLVFARGSAVFPPLGMLPVGRSEEIIPKATSDTVMGKRSIIQLVQNAWGDKLNAEGALPLLDFDFGITITYENHAGRQIETAVDLRYSYASQKLRQDYWDRIPKNEQKIFDIKDTRFRLLLVGQGE